VCHPRGGGCRRDGDPAVPDPTAPGAGGRGWLIREPPPEPPQGGRYVRHPRGGGCRRDGDPAVPDPTAPGAGGRGWLIRERPPEPPQGGRPVCHPRSGGCRPIGGPAVSDPNAFGRALLAQFCCFGARAGNPIWARCCQACGSPISTPNAVQTCRSPPLHTRSIGSSDAPAGSTLPSRCRCGAFTATSASCAGGLDARLACSVPTTWRGRVWGIGLFGRMV